MGWSDLSQRLYITGAYLVAILVPLCEFFCFNDLRAEKSEMILNSGRLPHGQFQKP
jgi:hypothetical protein